MRGPGGSASGRHSPSVTRMSTFPVAPSATASWAAAVSASGNQVNGRPAPSPTGERAVGDRRRHVLCGGREGFLADGVEQQALPPDVLGEAGADGGGESVTAVVGVVPDGTVVRDHVDVEVGVLGDGDLDDVVDPLRRERADAVGERIIGILQHVVRTAAARASASFSSLLTVAMTVAPAHTASWMAAWPTAPAPPCTRTVRVR